MLAAAPAREREQVARRDIINVHDVETGVDVGRHASRGGILHHAAGRGRLHVARAHRCGRVDDDHRRACPGGFARHLLRQKLRALVVTDHVGKGDRAVLAPR